MKKIIIGLQIKVQSRISRTHGMVSKEADDVVTERSEVRVQDADEDQF